MLRRSYGSLESHWQEMERLRREMNRLFDRTSTVSERRASRGYPSLNLWTGEDGVVVTAELPGLDPENTDISVEGDTLILSGDRQLEALQEGGTYHRRERRHGKFDRAIQLPCQVESDRVEAVFEKGVLHISLPRAEEEKPKKIAIKVG
jgi:HSP20 family protein